MTTMFNVKFGQCGQGLINCCNIHCECKYSAQLERPRNGARCPSKGGDFKVPVCCVIQKKPIIAVSLHNMMNCVCPKGCTLNLGIFNMRALMVCYHWDSTNYVLPNCVGLKGDCKVAVHSVIHRVPIIVIFLYWYCLTVCVLKMHTNRAWRI